MPRTAAQIEASRRNGAASRGPVTAAGKAISAHNVHRHGLCAAAVSLTRTEDPEELRALHAAVLERYRPVDMVEHALCAEISAALWQKRRARLLEAQLLDREHARLLPARSRERATPPGIPDDWQPLPSPAEAAAGPAAVPELFARSGLAIVGRLRSRTAAG